MNVHYAAVEGCEIDGGILEDEGHLWGEVVEALSEVALGGKYDFLVKVVAIDENFSLRIRLGHTYHDSIL